jgi:hypothetical protein
LNYQCTTNNIAPAQQEEPAPLVKNDSFSSADDMPTRTTKMTLKIAYDTKEDEKLDKEVSFYVDR